MERSEIGIACIAVGAVMAIVTKHIYQARTMRRTTIGGVQEYHNYRHFLGATFVDRLIQTLRYAGWGLVLIGLALTFAKTS